MKVLVIGQGGREHALVRALKLSPSVGEVHAIPGSRGMAGEAICHEIPLSDAKAVASFCHQHTIDLVVIGPEVPLAEGLSDQLRAEDLPVFGPSQAAAQLEASKVFSKQFMERAGVPTARYYVVSSVTETMEKSKEFAPPFVLKADGLAAGKGVFICKTEDELQQAAHSLFVEKSLGESGRRALLEEFQPGWELSFLILTNGQAYQPLPLSQDHKRLGEGDTGPNTGGMGVVGPLEISPDLRERIHQDILTPSIRQLAAESLVYRGILYVGVMVTADGPSVLEYNVRFGDPEAQVVLPLLKGDWGEVMKSVSLGQLPELKWRPIHCACVVLAAEGYPDQPKKGVVIEGSLKGETANSYFLHAGTQRDSQGQWLTGGGRVLNAVGIGSTLKEALDVAYAQAERARWPGRQMRRDIGYKILESQ